MSSLDSYLKTIRKFTPLNKKEEKEYFKKAKKGDRAAYELLINSNLRFVVSVAKNYIGRGLELEELIQEGNLGLMKAYDKFDLAKNCKFITYAVWWIRQSILMALHEKAIIIRLPANKISNIAKSRKLKTVLEQKLAEHVSITELAKYIDDPVILEDLKYNVSIIDLDQSNTDNEKTLHDVLKAPDNLMFDIEILKDELEDILKDFSEREKDILYMYFGINEIRPYTLKEIGYDMGLTRERIRQIKKQIIEKLQKKNLADRLRDYIR